MKKRFLAVSAILALCMTMLAVGLSVNAASETYTYTMLQDFESADANTDAYIWGGGAALAFEPDSSVKNTGNQSVKVTMGGEANGQVVNNLYPKLSVTDFSGFEGICYWIKTDAGTTVSDVDGTKMVGRIEGYVQTTAGVRYAMHTAHGDLYMVADGTTDKVAMAKAGDGRYWLPANFTGYIYVPFDSLADWTAESDMSAIHEMALGLHSGDFVNNVYYVDSVQGYGKAAAEEPSETTEKMLQDFESADANTDAYIWGGGAALTFEPDSSVKNTGNQSVKVTMGGEANGQVVNNLYPKLSVTDFSGFEGICYWIKTDAGTTVSDVDGTKMVGRIEGYVQTTAGVRYAMHTAHGDLYMVADGTTDKVAMAKAGDGRYWLPANFTGYIYVPFDSLADWTAESDMSAIHEMALGLHSGDFVNNVYYVDSVALYGGKASEEPESSETPESSEEPESSETPESSEPTEPELPDGEIDPLMIQNFEKRYVTSSINRWVDGAAAEMALVAGKGVNGSTAVQITFGGRNGVQQSFVAFVTPQNIDLSAGKTLMFYAENPQTGDDGQVALGFTFEETSGERWFMGEGKKYYLVSIDGEAKEQQNGGDGRLVIPAGFKGWVIVPQTSFKLNMGTLVDGERDLSAVGSCLIDADSAVAEGKTVYIDEYKMSEKSAAALINEMSTPATPESSESTESLEPVTSTPEASEETSDVTSDVTSEEDSSEVEEENPDTGVVVPVVGFVVLTAAATVAGISGKNRKRS